MRPEKEEDVITVGKLVIYKNALIYGNSVIQISNICSVWVADHSYTLHNKLPTWIKILPVVGLVLLGVGVDGENLLSVLLGIAAIGIAIYSYRKHKPTTPVAKFALGIERASGRIMLFNSPEEKIVQQSAKALMQVMAEKENKSEMIVMNFDKKEIKVENAIGSTIIGGDVSNNLVESLANGKDHN